MIRRIFLTIVVTAAALWAATSLVPGFSVGGGLRGYLIAGAVLGFLNTLIRPILKLITLPLILLTFGLFTAVINIFLLALAAHLTGLIFISGLAALLWATVIISLVHIVLNH